MEHQRIEPYTPTRERPMEQRMPMREKVWVRPWPSRISSKAGGRFGVAERTGIGMVCSVVPRTTGFPVSPLTPATFLVAGLAKLDLADHQKYTFGFLFLASIVMTVTCVVIGIFPL